MGHFKYKSTTRAQQTSPEWLSIGAQVGQLANIWSARYDLVGYVGPGAGGPAPACFTPATAEIEVNVDVAFGKATVPADIGDLRDRSNHFAWPKAVGAIFHEALHARYSLWDIEAAHRELSSNELNAILFLEEGRIEYQGLQVYPENAGFLRACALQIVLADVEADGVALDGRKRSAANLAALTCARVDAGSLDESDIEVVKAQIIEVLGEDTYNKLRSIWLRAQEYSVHHNAAAGLYELAREWAALLDEVTADDEEDNVDGDNPGGMSGSAGELLEALKEAAENAEIGSYSQLADQELTEEYMRQAKSRGEEAKTQKEHETVANEIFGKGTGPMPETRTRSSLVDQRPPRGPERAAAVKIAQMLEKAKYRDRDETEIQSILPPGRLRTRAMVQGAALKSKGLMANAKPWRRTMRKHTDDPTLTIGVMVDISGSMGAAMEPMAVTAWVMSEAVRRIQGRAAMVYFGEGVFSGLKAGQHLTEVNVYSAADGTEKFNSAFKALNGSLNLLNGTGARLLVVVSDACYTTEEARHARAWVESCGRAGVGVLWLPFDKGESARTMTNGTSAVLLLDTEQPAEAASQIGGAAARALQAVS